MLQIYRQDLSCLLDISEKYEYMKSLSSNFMSPRDQKTALEKLGEALGGNITISDAEMSRME
jgi:hypothetical protein